SCFPTNQCVNGGTCYFNGFENACSCLPAYTGKKCETYEYEGSACSANPNYCKNGGTCKINNNALMCLCPPPYIGATCQQIAQNGTNTVCGLILDRCRNGGTCLPVGFNAFTCQCAPGWTGLSCETPTTSTSNCLSNPSLCLNGGQ
ncbi:unnamed protein product, partial [Rotaria magnacalcarata]